MKPKKFNKKLILNKKTVSHLNNMEMGNANGGGGETGIGCPIPDTRNCTLPLQNTCDGCGSGILTIICCD